MRMKVVITWLEEVLSAASSSFGVTLTRLTLLEVLIIEDLLC